MTEEEIKHIQALTNDRAHIRKNALRVAGYYLQGSERDIMNMLVQEIDEDIVEDGGDLYLAHEELMEAISREIVKIGEELTAQAKTEEDNEQ